MNNDYDDDDDDDTAIRCQNGTITYINILQNYQS